MHSKTLARLAAGAILAVAVAAAMPGERIGHAQSSTSNTVNDWNELTMTAPIGPVESLAYVALVHLAIYDAVVAVEGGYQPFAYTGTNPSASAEAAASTAAHRVIVEALPAIKAGADTLYATQMGAIPDGAAKTGGVAIGEGAAAAILALPLRGQITPGVPYTPKAQPDQDGKVPAGVWQPTSPSAPIATWAPNATPLTFGSSTQYRPGPPPSLDSSEWVAAFNEVRDYGGADSTVRTQAETDLAIYYSEQPAIQPNKSFRGFVTERNLDLLDAARYMAMVSTGVNDALIGCFEAKYYYQFWRPIQSIPGDDGNPATEHDPDWNIAIAGTPNHPEYPAAHSCATSTWSLLTAYFLGTDQINFTGETTVAGRETRFWPTVEDALADVANARIYGGLHYRFSTEAGAGIATKVASNIKTNYFKPVSAPPKPPAPMPPSTGSGQAGAGAPVVATAAILAGFLLLVSAGWLAAQRGRRAG